MASIQSRKDSHGKVRYRVQIRLKGYPMESATFDRKTDAKRWAQQTESAIQEGRHFKTAEAKKHTLGELIERYKRGVLAYQPKKKRVQTVQLNWWKAFAGDYLLKDITPVLITEGRDLLLREIPNKKNGDKERKPRSNATVVRYMAALSHALNIAVKEWSWLESNPAQKVTKPKEPRGRVRFLSDAERKALLKTCQASENKFLYPVVVLALSTGMRLGEIMSLSWESVDLNMGRVILHETKNDDRRNVPLAGHALEVVKQHVKVRRLNSTLLFPSRVDPNKPIDIRTPWEAALKQAEIEDFKFHDLRHSAASYLAMNGASLAEIAEVLGHKTLQMVKRYAHLSEAHTASVVASMNEKIFG